MGLGWRSGLAGLCALALVACAIEPGGTVPECMAKMNANKGAGGPVATAIRQIPTLTAFVKEKDLVSIPGTEQALVRESPPYNRQNSAYIDPPGPFEKGVPSIVQRTLVRPPSSQLGPLDAAARAAVMAASPVQGKYEQLLDRDSAYEKLRARSEAAAREATELEQRQVEEKREFERARRYDADGYGEPKAKKSSTSGRSDSIGTAFAKSFARQLGTKSGQALVRGILGSIFGKR